MPLLRDSPVSSFAEIDSVDRASQALTPAGIPGLDDYSLSIHQGDYSDDSVMLGLEKFTEILEIIVGKSSPSLDIRELELATIEGPSTPTT